MLAEVVVFGFNRADALERLLESLENCHLASESIVHLYIDGARSESDQAKINEVKNLINKRPYQFGKFKITYREENFGLAKSLRNGISEVFQQSDKVIVLEDDLVLSPNFLKYMNDALDYYNSYEQVGSISGFTTKLKNNSSDDVYFHPRPCSWGWATWKNRWDGCDWDYKPDNFIQSLMLRLKTYKAGEDVFRMFNNQLNKKINSWAILWTIDHLRKNFYVVYPFVSKVKNTGFGDDATHCRGMNPFPTNFHLSGKLILYSLRM